jgi:hypothetical protein
MMRIVPETEEVILLVDFNELREDDSLLTYSDLSFGPWKPQEGLSARLIDGEGCSCVGDVKRVVGEEVEVVPDWSTWVCDPPGWTTSWTPPEQAVENAERSEEDDPRTKEPDTKGYDDAAPPVVAI